MSEKIYARIAGTGSFTPSQVMTNADLEKIVDTSDEWITTRTGIKERRIAPKEMTSVDMSVEACTAAMEMAGWSPEDVEMTLVGTITPDYRLPSNACVIQERLGLVNSGTMDLAAACAGFIHALATAAAFIETRQIKRALVVGVEKLTSITNYNDRGTCILFGDAAGATAVEATTEKRGVLSSFMKSDGRLAKLLWIPVGGVARPWAEASKNGGMSAGEDCLYMNGSEVFKHAVRQMGDAALQVIERAGIHPDDVNLVVPHQANIRIIDALAKRLKLPEDRVFVNIEKYGNTSSASVPLALDEAVRSGRIQADDYVLMLAFGGGLTWGATLIRW
ncbi:MAG TPA: beta-ketoacyl-ACP synthase III [candidate division Zixibacteria bacterium]|nr:beta-ketoacyl-ACP synthase III [candidate division Zixibacteria bacterium]